jgi:Cu-Zn family superoxide dismutase
MIGKCAVLLGFMMVAGCASAPMGPDAVAELSARSGSSVMGTVTFTQVGAKVTVIADVSGLKPNAEHGFHIHDKGDCSAPDAMSTGGHFNPAGKAHGSHAMADHHAGDLPSLKADAAGKALVRAELEGLSVGSGTSDIVGRAVIVHRDPDDFKTQPTGNSGARIACGVIVKRS